MNRLICVALIAVTVAGVAGCNRTDQSAGKSAQKPPVAVEIAVVTGLLAESDVNIASMQVSREQRGANALMLIETDAEVDRVTAERIAKQPGVTSVRRVAAV